MTVIQKEKSYLLDRRSRRWEALKVGDSAPRLFSFLRHLALRFWNQTCCLNKEWKLISWIYTWKGRHRESKIAALICYWASPFWQFLLSPPLISNKRELNSFLVLAANNLIVHIFHSKWLIIHCQRLFFFLPLPLFVHISRGEEKWSRFLKRVNGRWTSNPVFVALFGGSCASSIYSQVAHTIQSYSKRKRGIHIWYIKGGNWVLIDIESLFGHEKGRE